MCAGYDEAEQPPQPEAIKDVPTGLGGATMEAGGGSDEAAAAAATTAVLTSWTVAGAAGVKAAAAEGAFINKNDLLVMAVIGPTGMPYAVGVGKANKRMVSVCKDRCICRPHAHMAGVSQVPCVRLDGVGMKAR